MQDRAQVISPDEAARGDWFIVDVRSSQEFSAEHAPTTLNIPLEHVEDSLSFLQNAANGRLALLCKAGTRAALAQQRLAQRGVPTAVVQGGIDAWKQHGLPIASHRCTLWSLERQVRLIAGLLVFAGTLAAALFSTKWLWLTGFVGAGLIFAGLTDICMMGRLLAKMPWNAYVRPYDRTRDS